MLRVLVELVVLANGLAVGAGYVMRRLRRQRRQSHLEYMKQLEAENKEMDQSLERMTK